MNPIVSSELTLFAQELQRFLSPIVLQETAKQVGFVQRSSKYQATELISLFNYLVALGFRFFKVKKRKLNIILTKADYSLTWKNQKGS